MNNRLAAVIAATALAVGITGCTAAPTAAKPSATVHTPSATPSPTPTVMTVAEAGKKYLLIVCPANRAGDALTDAFNKQKLAEIKAKAVLARAAWRTSAQAFVDDTTLWPAGISADLQKLSDSDFAAVAWADAVANSKTLAGANAQVLADDGSGAIAQKVRAKLNLPASTKC